MKIAIWGLGFVGQNLYKSLDKSKYFVDCYSKTTKIDSSIIFDAANPNHSKNFTNHYDTSIITFPPQYAHDRFIDMLFDCSQKVILLGTTSIYIRDPKNLNITEETELDKNHSRYHREQEFLARGGQILRLAGLYGQKRNPLNWLSSPRVGYSNKQLNLIYNDDIAKAIELLLETSHTRALYNLSDGVSHSWKDIIDYGLAIKAIDKQQVKDIPDTPSYFIANNRFCNQFPNFVFNDLFTYLKTNLF